MDLGVGAGMGAGGHDQEGRGTVMHAFEPMAGGGWPVWVPGGMQPHPHSAGASSSAAKPTTRSGHAAQEGLKFPKMPTRAALPVQGGVGSDEKQGKGWECTASDGGSGVPAVGGGGGEIHGSVKGFIALQVTAGGADGFASTRIGGADVETAGKDKMAHKG